LDYYRIYQRREKHYGNKGHKALCRGVREDEEAGHKG
jgi:hypothetical protein